MDNRLAALRLVQRGLCDAALFDSQGAPQFTGSIACTQRLCSHVGPGVQQRLRRAVCLSLQATCDSSHAGFVSGPWGLCPGVRLQSPVSEHAVLGPSHRSASCMTMWHFVKGVLHESRVKAAMPLHRHLAGARQPPSLPQLSHLMHPVQQDAHICSTKPHTLRRGWGCPAGTPQIPMEAFRKKNVLLTRGRFQPFTSLHNDMLAGAASQVPTLMLTTLGVVSRGVVLRGCRFPFLVVLLCVALLLCGCLQPGVWP